jgi:hypothetical protein
MGLSFDADPNTTEFNFFATHLDASNQTNRTAQAGFINSLVANSTTPAVLAGDMNSRPSTDSYALLASNWTDATNIANPGIMRNTQIDYVFYRSDQWRVQQRGQFIVNPTTTIASDHYPLLTVIDLYSPNADFDGDFDVDGADLLIWQRHAGADGGPAQGDADENGAVNDADLNVWRAQFGTARPQPPRAATVPEPCTGAAIALATTPVLTARRLCFRFRRRCRSSQRIMACSQESSSPCGGSPAR